MNPFHIAPRTIETVRRKDTLSKGFVTPGKTLCGKYIDTLSAYLYPDQVEGHGEPICEDCYDSPDYPLLLLADIGEPTPDPWDGINIGTVTGRLTASQPNYSNVAQTIKDEASKVQDEVRNLVNQSIVSPADYADLEMRMAITTPLGQDKDD